MKDWQKLIIVVLVFGLCNGLLLQPRINRVRNEDGHLEPEIDITPVDFLGSGMVAGFRGPAVSFLWMKAHSLEMKQRYYEIPAITELITKLQPTVDRVWVFSGWNLAYNISIEWRDATDRWKWIKQGLDVI